VIVERAKQYLPVLTWLPAYDRSAFTGDLLAGLIVAIMLVPQGMAYALLAGLPPEVGLYASILPLIVYGLFGSSRTLAVGPVAIVSLMVATTLGPMVEAGTIGYVSGAVLLAFLSGVLLLAMGIARLGVLVNFLSHPVISGFTSAAALVIGFSQLKHLLGFSIPRSHLITETVAHAAAHVNEWNLVTVAIAALSLVILLAWRGLLPEWLSSLNTQSTVVEPISKAGPLIAVLFSTLTVWALSLTDYGVKVIADVPAGLPSLTLPPVDVALLQELLPAALLISLIGFLESVSVAKSLASKRRQKVDANQELIALGAANIGASLSGGYPVTGGFSRSLVNFTSGAVTPLASIITAMLVALTLMIFTPLLYFLPKATLAIIIIVAVAGLIDTKMLKEAWCYNKADAFSLIATFASVLWLGIEVGIIAGAGRNVLRHDVKTDPHVLAIRIDESLYFANIAGLEEKILAEVADHQDIEHLVLIMSAVNFIDTSALETIENLIVDLKEAGVTLHLAEVKGPVSDRLMQIELKEKLGAGKIFLSTHEALKQLTLSPYKQP